MHGEGLVTAPLALYYNFRLKSGFPANKDTGAFMEPAVKALVSQGVGSESLWPYEPSNFATQPSAEYQRQAFDHRVSKHYRAQTVLQAKTAISQGLPVVIAFDVPRAFTTETGESGVWTDRGGAAVGGHAVCIMGYDDERHGGSFKVQNSWGTSWGDNGLYWLPYSAYLGPRYWDGIVLTTWDLEAGQ